MKSILITLFCSVLFLSACNPNGGSSIGDGKVDIVEAAVIQVAVGAAMSAKPELIAPSYAVSTALLTMLDASTITSPSMLETVLGKEIDKLNLDPLTRQSVLDLVALIKAKIVQELNLTDAPNTKMIVLKQIVQIVHDTAAARIIK